MYFFYLGQMCNKLRLSLYSKEKRDLGVEKKKKKNTKTKQTGEKQVSLFKFNLPIENVMSADCLNLSVSAEAPPTSRVYFTASLA